MLTDALWGGTLDTFVFDMTSQVLTLAIGILHGETHSTHELQLGGIAEFRFFSNIEGPWDYVEVTELHFERDEPTDQWIFDLILWSEDASLSGRCTSVLVDGTPLTAGGDG